MYNPQHPLKGLWTLKRRIEDIINENNGELNEEELFLLLWKKYGYLPSELYRVRYNLGYTIDQDGKVRVAKRLYESYHEFF